MADGDGQPVVAPIGLDILDHPRAKRQAVTAVTRIEAAQCAAQRDVHPVVTAAQADPGIDGAAKGVDVTAALGAEKTVHPEDAAIVLHPPQETRVRPSMS